MNNTDDDEILFCYLCDCDLGPDSGNDITFCVVLNPRKRPDGDLICESCNDRLLEGKKKKEQIKIKTHKCVVCDEDKPDIGFKCKTCKNNMCQVCCCEYDIANPNKFRVEGDETGYALDIFVPCPVCRTINSFGV
jgi:hypothetical protein